MSDYFEKPTHWRLRADMTRTIADGMPSDSIRHQLLDIAKQYEALAKSLEQQLKQQQGEQSEAAVDERLVRIVPEDDGMQQRIAELQKKWNSRRR